MHDQDSSNQSQKLPAIPRTESKATSELSADESMTIEEHLRMIETWAKPLRSGEEPFMRERAIPVHVQQIRKLVADLDVVAGTARDFVWEPENWEAYMESKDSISVAWHPEFLLMAQAVEKQYGPMPVDDEPVTSERTGARNDI